MDNKRTMQQYWLLMNNIAYWLVRNNKKFNTRQVYGYQNRTADYGTIIKVIKERAGNTQPDALIAEFVECAIVDNKDLSFLPNYVSEPYNNGNKLSRDVYVDMARRVSEWEVKHNGQSPNYVTVKATGGNTTNNNKKHGYLLKQGCNNLGQCNSYNCGPHSLMQGYYNLTGIHINELTLASACGTTTAGTSHQGLATGLAWLNKKYNTNITIEWKNFSDLGWTELQKLIDDPNTSVFWHELYRNKWGHYSFANHVTGSLNVLNSLGSKCRSPAYCGYQERRSQSTQRSYWRGISQKSICILKRR